MHMLEDVRVVPWRLWRLLRGVVVFMSRNAFHFLLLCQSVLENKETDFKQKKGKSWRPNKS